MNGILTHRFFTVTSSSSYLPSSSRILATMTSAPRKPAQYMYNLALYTFKHKRTMAQTAPMMSLKRPSICSTLSKTWSPDSSIQIHSIVQVSCKAFSFVLKLNIGWGEFSCSLLWVSYVN